MKKSSLNLLILTAAVVAIFTSYSPDQTLYYLLKPLTTILIIGLPVLFHRDLASEVAAHRTSIILALTFCLVGDILLLNDAYFGYGLAAFLVAHLMFARVFFKLSNEQLHPIPLLILLAVSLSYFWFLKPTLGKLMIPVAVYFACILIMCWQGIRISLSRKDKWGYCVGIAALLFVMSDSIIAANKFIMQFDAAGALILSSYWLSITIIANLFSTDT